jgi:hypothetical protein
MQDGDVLIDVRSGVEEATMRSAYALARVTVVRAAVARSLLWTGVLGGVAGAFIPALVPLGTGASVGGGLGAAALAYGLLRRAGWWRQQAEAARKAPFAATVEPPRQTRWRHLRSNGPRVLAGLVLVTALGLVAGPAAGLAVTGLGLGLLLSVWRLSRWQRSHELLLWVPTDAGWLLGRGRNPAPWSTTGPAAGSVRPVVHPAGAARR